MQGAFSWIIITRLKKHSLIEMVEHAQKTMSKRCAQVNEKNSSKCVHCDGSLKHGVFKRLRQRPCSCPNTR